MNNRGAPASSQSLQSIMAIDMTTALSTILPLFFIQFPPTERTERGKVQFETRITLISVKQNVIRYI